MCVLGIILSGYRPSTEPWNCEYSINLVFHCIRDFLLGLISLTKKNFFQECCRYKEAQVSWNMYCQGKARLCVIKLEILEYED